MPYATRRSYSGSAATCTLTSSITSVSTTATLTGTVTNWPVTSGGPFFMVIDPGLSTEEKVLVGSRSTTSLSSITRGVDGTTAAAHSAGATCYPVFTAVDADQANAVAATLTTKGDILATNGSALNRLAVGTNDFALLADSAATNGVAWKQIPAAGLASNSVTAAKLASNSVETAKILNANVTADKLATGSVTTAKIADLNVTGAKLANVTVSTKTGSYTLVAADRNTRIAMNSASSTSITVNSSLFSAGDVVYIHNIGAGTCTVTAGTATVNTEGALELAQWGGGTLYFTSASSAIFFRYRGVETPETSPYHYEGSLYQYDIFTSSGSWAAPVTSADVIVVAGGGGAGRLGGGGGAGGVRNLIAATFVIGNTYTVTVGAAGTMSNTAPTAGGNSSITTSGATISATGGGRGGVSGAAASAGGSGGGGYLTLAGAAGNAGGYTPAEGFAGSTGRNVQAGANGSGGGATSAALAGAQGAPYGGGNRDVAGRCGIGFNLPDDLTDFGLFDNLRVPTNSSLYSNVVRPNVAIAWGGLGQGYAGFQGVLSSDAVGAYTGGTGSTYNSAASGARGWGNGACSGSGTNNITAGTGGIVIIRYAL
jgi:hypothetical protein